MCKSKLDAAFARVSHSKFPIPNSTNFSPSYQMIILGYCQGILSASLLVSLPDASCAQFYARAVETYHEQHAEAPKLPLNISDI